MPDHLSPVFRRMKMLVTRKLFVYILFGFGSVSLVYICNTKNAPQKLVAALVNAHRSDHYLFGEYLVNETWTTVRKVLLSEQNVSKVIILAHARGGSTLCSDLFNIETNNTVLWYEALHGFHSFYSGVPHYNTDTLFLYYQNLTRRPADDAKRNALAKYLTQLMTCDFENIPVELVSMTPFMRKSAVFKDFVRCTDQIKAFKKFSECQKMISIYCFREELLNTSSYRVNDSVVSSFKCAELLQSIKRLKSISGNRLTINEILRSYFSDQDTDKTNLERDLYSSCPHFSDHWRTEKVTPVLKTESDKRCMNFENKLKLFVKHDHCLEGLHRGTLACRQKMAEPCRRTRLTVAEFQRVFMEDLEPFIQQMPDIHVVHYVRDPRAVSISRAEKHIHTFRFKGTWTAVYESYLLCERMRYDIQHKKRLQQIYSGSIITVRYEDLVIDPRTTVERMYEFFGRPVPRELDDWVKRTMQADKDNGMYGVHRSNGKLHLSKWRSNISVDDLDVMNQQCLDVLNEYDYQL